MPNSLINQILLGQRVSQSSPDPSKHLSAKCCTLNQLCCDLQIQSPCQCRNRFQPVREGSRSAEPSRKIAPTMMLYAEVANVSARKA
jgi:hypothetical protein